MRRYVSVFLLASLLLLPVSENIKAYSESSAETYLKDHGESPWAVMALTALGSSNINTNFLKSINVTTAIQLEAPILAITSIGEDPRTFGNTDYIAALKTYHTNNQIGDDVILNDDIFGILALASAGTELTDVVIVDAKNFILNHQNSDGGWSFGVTGNSDTNTTASAILALLASGVTADSSNIANAINYLKSTQKDNGGFPYDPTSSWGNASDTSSTAWVMWAMTSLGIANSSWTKNGLSPIDYLNTTQQTTGFFEYQVGSEEDSFSPITTSYAAIALAGKTLPLKTISAPLNQFDFRVEGASEQICAGKTTARTALDIVKNASALCGFTYHIAETSFGPYLDKINNDEASGLTGWLYLVNNISPPLGAADYNLQPQDEALWYFGDFSWLPTRLSLSSTEAPSNTAITATVESFSNNTWSPVEGALVAFGANTATTNNNGQATISPADGYYKIFATKNGYVRSNSILLKIGTPTNASVALNANVEGGQVLGDDDINNPNATNTIAFTVAPTALDFGSLTKGTYAEKTITIANTGSIPLHVESIALGDELFTQGVNIGGVIWQNYKTDIAQSQNKNETIKLSVPLDYSGSGPKTGQITFWAIAQ